MQQQGHLLEHAGWSCTAFCVTYLYMVG